MLTRLHLDNFKSWKDTGDIALKPITGFFGANSSGKTSLIQALLLLKQTADSPDRGILFHFGDRRTPVDLGDFGSVVYGHDANNTLKISLAWEKDSPFEVTDTNTEHKFDESNHIGFEVASREDASKSGKSIIVERMSYKVGDAVFGLRRNDKAEYDLFAEGTKFEFTRSRGRVWPPPPPVKCYGFPDQVRAYFTNAGFLSDLEFGLEERLGNVYYLGPLRAHPERRYTWAGTQPTDVGQAGESVVDAILASRKWGKVISPGYRKRRRTLEEHIANWFKDLGLIHNFRVEPLADGSPVFEVRVRKSARAPEVLITDVGFGVSQILPVLVLCFYVPEGSTVILEQPEIHLHPAIQSGLADVLIDAWKNRKIQILLESHSEHLLRRLQRRIAEETISEEEVGLFFCSTGDTGSSLRPLEFDQYASITNWPTDFFGDQFGEIAAMRLAGLKRQGATN